MGAWWWSLLCVCFECLGCAGPVCSGLELVGWRRGVEDLENGVQGRVGPLSSGQRMVKGVVSTNSWRLSGSSS
jgi:hypothetical protein